MTKFPDDIPNPIIFAIVGAAVFGALGLVVGALIMWLIL